MWRDLRFGIAFLMIRMALTVFPEGRVKILCPMATRQIEEWQAERDTLRGLLREASQYLGLSDDLLERITAALLLATSLGGIL